MSTSTETTIYNNGTMNINGGNFESHTGAIITNDTDGKMIITEDVTFQIWIKLVNKGTIENNSNLFYVQKHVDGNNTQTGSIDNQNI